MNPEMLIAPQSTKIGLFIYRQENALPRLMLVTKRADISCEESGTTVFDVIDLSQKFPTLEAQIRGWEKENGFFERVIANRRRLDGQHRYPGLVEQTIIFLAESGIRYYFDKDSNRKAQLMHRRVSKYRHIQSLHAYGKVGRVVGVIRK